MARPEHAPDGLGLASSAKAAATRSIPGSAAWWRTAATSAEASAVAATKRGDHSAFTYWDSIATKYHKRADELENPHA